MQRLTLQFKTTLSGESIILQAMVRHVYESQGFFRDLPAIKGGVEALKEMSGMEG